MMDKTANRRKIESIDTDVTISGTHKRRKFNSEDVFQLQHCSKFNENVVSSISDLKAKCVSETDIFSDSRETKTETDTKTENERESESSTSSVICLEAEEMEESTTSCQKTPRVPELEKMPCAAEIEEFFTKAEKYEQNRFSEKYNFDIVKDVPLEGRYQWVPLPLKP